MVTRKVLISTGRLLAFLLVFQLGNAMALGQSDTTAALDSGETPEYEFFQVSEKAEFPGGEGALKKFIAKNLMYPKAAIEAEVQGVVIVQFVVLQDGSTRDFDVLSKELGYGLEEAALGVLKKMPKWKPARVGDKPVKMMFRIPVRFQLY